MSGVSVFGNGFAQGVVIRGVPLVQTHPGKVFFVGNGAAKLPGEKGASNGNKGGLYDPFSTIDYAVGQCTASRGDVIFVKPGHVETVTAAAGLDLDVAGIALIGLGSGSLRPQINFTTATTADMDVDADNITMVNFLFTGGVDALAAPIDVNAADFKLFDSEWRDVTGQATDVILTDANANRMLIDGYSHIGDTAAGGASAIAIVGGTNIKIKNFTLKGNFSVSAIDVRTTATTRIEVESGYIWTVNAADKAISDTITASTGRIGPNIHVMVQDNAANITEAVAGATFHFFQPINICNLAGEVGMQTNITASTDA